MFVMVIEEKKRCKGLMLNISYIEKEINKNHIRENAGQGRTRCDSGSESIDKHEPRDIWRASHLATHPF
jgi:hypothetical protein